MSIGDYSRKKPEYPQGGINLLGGLLFLVFFAMGGVYLYFWITDPEAMQKATQAVRGFGPGWICNSPGKGLICHRLIAPPPNPPPRPAK